MPEPENDAIVERVTDDAALVSAPFSSLYYTQTGTIAAIVCGMAIIIVVQIKVARIFGSARSIIEALTYFATSMVAVLVGIYVCDLLIAGPNVLLLREGERSSIVNFVKDICLMVFAYFFGTKTASTDRGDREPVSAFHVRGTDPHGTDCASGEEPRGGQGVHVFPYAGRRDARGDPSALR
jgi:hypothetical protein